MARRIYSKLKKRGSVLAIVLFAIILLLLSGMGILTVGQTSRIFSIRTTADMAARSAADTGITKAIYEMNAKLFNGTWDGKAWLWEFRKELPNSDAKYSYFVAKANWYYGDVMPTGDEPLIDFFRSASGSDGDYIVTSLGRHGKARRKIYATIRLQGSGDTCVIVRDKLTLKAGTLVAGADSRNGPVIDPTVLTEIGTTSVMDDDVVLNNGVSVLGNVVVGVNGNVDTVIKDLGGTVTGLQYSMPQEVDFPYVYPPAISAEFQAFDVPIRIDKKNPPSPDPNVLVLTEADNGRYTCIDLESNNLTQKIVIASGNDVELHLTNTGNGTTQASIMLGVGCEILIEDGATLNLWVDGNIRSGVDSGFNNMGTPPDFKIWGNWREPVVGQEWQLNAKSEYFGQVYAPNADVVVNAKGHLYGAFTAYTFDMRNGGNLIYDGALRDVDPTEPGVRFILKRWYEQ